MVLRAHVSLHPLTVCTTRRIDVLPRLVAAHEGDGSNVRVRADFRDYLLFALDHVEKALGETCLRPQFRHEGHCVWHPFTRLKHESVSTHDRKWKHPQGAHCWEVEWSYTCANSQRGAERLAVHVGGNIPHSLAHQVGRYRVAMFQHFNPPKHTALGVGKCFSVLEGYEFCEFVLVFYHEA